MKSASAKETHLHLLQKEKEKESKPQPQRQRRSEMRYNSFVIAASTSLHILFNLELVSSQEAPYYGLRLRSENTGLNHVNMKDTVGDSALALTTSKIKTMTMNTDLRLGNGK